MFGKKVVKCRVWQEISFFEFPIPDADGITGFQSKQSTAERSSGTRSSPTVQVQVRGTVQVLVPGTGAGPPPLPTADPSILLVYSVLVQFKFSFPLLYYHIFWVEFSFSFFVMPFSNSNIAKGMFLLLTIPIVDGYLSTFLAPITSQRGHSPRFGKKSALFISTHSNTDRNFYAILQVNRKANDAEIKLAYRRLAKLYHPGMFLFLCLLFLFVVAVVVVVLVLLAWNRAKLFVFRYSKKNPSRFVVFPQIPIWLKILHFNFKNLIERMRY